MAWPLDPDIQLNDSGHIEDTNSIIAQIRAHDTALGKIPAVVTVAGFTQADITTAVAALPATGGKLVMPAGTYTGHLHITGVTDLYVEAYGAVLSEPVETVKPVSINSSTRVRIVGLTVRHTASTARNSSGHGIHVNLCTDVTLVGCTSTETSATGYFIQQSTRVTLSSCVASNTKADGFHITRISRNVTVSGCHAADTGDDGFATVSYLTDGDICQAVTFQGCTVARSGARGIGLVGGARLKVVGCDIEDTNAAGIYILRDTAYLTYGVVDAVVADTTINRANAYGTVGTTYAAVDIRGVGAYPIENVTISGNVIRSPGWRGINVGNSSGPDNVKRATIQGNTIVFTGAASAADGILVANTRHVDVSGNHIEKAGTNGVYVESTSTGSVRVSNNTVEDASELANGTADAFTIRAPGATVVGNNVIDNTGKIDRDYEFSSLGADAVSWANRTSGSRIESVTRPTTSRMSRASAETEGAAAPTAGTWLRGDFVWNTAPSASGALGWVCVGPGTMGTLNAGATTATTTSGSAVITVNTATGLLVGEYIAIAGVAGAPRVVSIVGTTVTLSGAPGATVAGAAVSYSAAVWRVASTISA